MIHPEGMPEHRHIATRITEAVIQKQKRELDAHSARILAANVYNATPREDIKKVGEILTGTSTDSAQNSDPLNKALFQDGDEENR